MATFVLRLLANRPSFADDMTDAEREIMSSHSRYWQPLLDAGQLVVFGPVRIGGGGSFGLAVVEQDDEERLRAFAAGDPVVTTGTAQFEIGRMPIGYVRPR